MAKLEHPHESQYLFDPDTPEQEAKKSKEHEEWCRTRNAFNIDNRMPTNGNGLDTAKRYPSDVYIENIIVHQYALRKVMLAPADKAWETYQKYRLAYLEYIKGGKPASSMFDPTTLESLIQA